MSNTERRWSQYKDQNITFWINGKAHFVIDLKIMRSSLVEEIKNVSNLTSLQYNEKWITDYEAKKMLLELFWRKYPNGKFISLITGLQNTTYTCSLIEISIKNGYVHYRNVAFLNLTTGEWAEGGGR